MNKKTIGLVVLILLILGVGLVFINNKTTDSLQNSPGSTVEPNIQDVTAGGQIKRGDNIYQIIIKDRKIVQGPETINVAQGDKVTIRFLSDEDGELHLHGYDEIIELKKDQTVEMKIDANISGRFIYELEDSKTDLGTLEVLPK